MTDPQIWWYITRASAILAWVLLTLSVLWGVLLSTRVARRIDNPSWLQDLHSYLAGTGLVLVGFHMVSLLFDEYINMGFADLLIPMYTSFEPMPVALGIVAAYLMAAIYVSSLIKDKLPRAVWRFIHVSAYLTVFAVAFHAGLVGTDVGQFWYTILSGTLIGLTALSLIVRVIAGRPGAGRKPRAAAAAPSATKTAVAATTTAPNSHLASAAPAASDGAHPMAVQARTQVARDIVRFDFRRVDGTPLPHWHPGDHISLRLPNGLARQYSLCGDPADADVWSIAVKLAEQSEGGSAWIHNNLKVGDQLSINGPAHKFELIPAHEYFFIAGGIGITPIWSMIQSLPASRTWRLLYMGRDRSQMAFATELVEQYPDRVQIWESDLDGIFNLAELSLGVRAHVYSCGPAPLLDALERVIPAERLHIERFASADIAPPSGAEGFRVELAKSGRSIEVSAEQTMLQALEASNVPVLASCREGICGSCEVQVLEGTPDHRDEVFDEATKAKMGVMYPCVSRAQSPVLKINA